MSFETISVIGLGYIGLPTAAAFASRKKKVIGVDVNAHAVETINRGAIPYRGARFRQSGKDCC